MIDALTIQIGSSDTIKMRFPQQQDLETLYCNDKECKQKMKFKMHLVILCLCTNSRISMNVHQYKYILSFN